MKQIEKWKAIVLCACAISILFMLHLALHKEWLNFTMACLLTTSFMVAFFGYYGYQKKRTFQDEIDISRVLGKDAKDALSFGNIGLLTFNDEYTITWQSAFFTERNLDLVNQKLTSWVKEIRDLFEDEVDYVIGNHGDQTFEIARKPGANLLFIKDITKYQTLSRHYKENGVVVGMMQLDNYMEYQSYENEDIMENINAHLRSPLITWAKEHGMMIRRLRSDRFIVILNQTIFDQIKREDFTILQIVKDEANKLDVSISLSMAFAYGTQDFHKLDTMLSDLIELAQSRGGDQVAYRESDGNVQFIGGNSESSSSRSKVRVHAMAQSIQEALRDANRVFIAGHTFTDFDCMGAALGISCWSRSLGKNAYIVLKDVVRDEQLDILLQRYETTLELRHTFITPKQAAEMIDTNKDVLVMVDHGVPSMSSAQNFVEACKNVIVIDHHRKGEEFVKNTLLSYVESTASSACELIVELVQSIPNHVPIYETEATIMYLGILVDTNRFKMHTDARTFEAAATLRLWGANATEAEKSLCIDYTDFYLKNNLLLQAKPVLGRFMVNCIEQPVDKTTLAQIASSLLTIRQAQATFVFGPLKSNPKITALSARSDGSFNVQKIVERLHGGGHFSAAAVERDDLSPEELKDEIVKQLEEEVENEGNIA